MTDYSEVAFNETFDIVYNDILNRKQNNKGFDKNDLKELLNTLYMNEGNNWTGHGEIVMAKHSATIAACEAILAEWDGQKETCK